MSKPPFLQIKYGHDEFPLKIVVLIEHGPFTSPHTTILERRIIVVAPSKGI